MDGRLNEEAQPERRAESENFAADGGTGSAEGEEEDELNVRLPFPLRGFKEIGPVGQYFRTRKQKMLKEPLDFAPGDESDKEFAMPEISPAEERKSFLWHYNNVMNLFPSAEPSELTKREACVVTCDAYSLAHWSIPLGWRSFEYMRGIIDECVDLDSSPGVGFEGCPLNKNVFDVLGNGDRAAGKDAVVRLAMKKIEAVLSGEKFEPPTIRIFIKQEGTKKKKIREGRPRMIWSCSLVEQVIAHAVMRASTHAEKRVHQFIPTKVGLSTKGSGWHDFICNMKRQSRRNEWWLGMDKTGWDMSVPGWLLRCEQWVRWELCDNRHVDVDGHFKKIFDWVYDGLCRARLNFSDGYVIEQTVDGCMKSGHVLTISTNSRMQYLLRICAGIECFGLVRKEALAAMGDDTIEESFDLPGQTVRDEQYRAKLREWGFHIKDEDFEHADGPDGLAFCSNRTFLIDGQYVPVLQNWGKTLFHVRNVDHKKDLGAALRSLLYDYVGDEEKFELIQKKLATVNPRMWAPRSVILRQKMGHGRLKVRDAAQINGAEEKLEQKGGSSEATSDKSQ